MYEELAPVTFAVASLNWKRPIISSKACCNDGVSLQLELNPKRLEERHISIDYIMLFFVFCVFHRTCITMYTHGSTTVDLYFGLGVITQVFN